MAQRPMPLETAEVGAHLAPPRPHDESDSELLHELVAQLRQHRTQLREEWANRITEARLLTAMSKEALRANVEYFLSCAQVTNTPIKAKKQTPWWELRKREAESEN